MYSLVTIYEGLLDSPKNYAEKKIIYILPLERDSKCRLHVVL